MKARTRSILPAVLTAALVAGAAATIPAVAATGDGTEGTEDTAEQSAPTDDARRGPGPVGRFGHHLAHGLEEGEFAERLAAELDLDTARVQDAIAAVTADLAEERLAAAVQDGRLTQDQADRIAAALAEGDQEAAREVFQEVRLDHLEQRLAEQVGDGELTQDEADEILERAEDGDFPGHRGHGGHGGGPRGLGGPPADDAADVDPADA